MSISPSEVIVPAPGFVDKTSHHPVAQLLLGTVVGVQRINDSMILFYADGHKVRVAIDNDGDIAVGDFQVPMC